MIPAFVNVRGGSAPAAREALADAGAFDIHAITPETMPDVLRDVLASRPPRIVVAGGDGTIALAAGAVCKTDTALGIMPGGTLNHFAKDLGIPNDPRDAAEVAATGHVVSADVGYAGDQLFLNTSSVGTYVTYVRVRERFERYVGYRVASVLAAFRLLFTIRPVRVTLEIDGAQKQYDTPLVFIGVGERELKAPMFGRRVEGGRQALHVMVVRERRASRLLAVALAAIARGVEEVAQTPELDSFLVDRCTISTIRPRPAPWLPRVALDGEIVPMPTPIEYRIEPEALRVIVP